MQEGLGDHPEKEESIGRKVVQDHVEQLWGREASIVIDYTHGTFCGAPTA